MPKVDYQETVNFNTIYIYTVKPVLRGHLWDKEKVPYKTGVR